MGTGLERIAARARCERKLRFTSLCHHITRIGFGKFVAIPQPLGTGGGWSGGVGGGGDLRGVGWVMLPSIHRKGYGRPTFVGYIPKPGKPIKRPLGVPCVSDRALQRSTSEVPSAVYEQDFPPCSFGGRPRLSAHHALSTLTEVIAGRKVRWVLEADLKNFFGSLDHGWLLRFVDIASGTHAWSA